KNQISKKPEEFRDRKLTDIIATQVTRLSLKTAAGEMELQKQADHWQIVKPLRARADDQKVNDFIAQITTSRIAQFVADDAADLPKYGLDKPQLTVTLSSFASENTAETQAGEHPLATIAFGKIDGENIFARVGEEPFVVAVRRSTLDNIFADPLQWQELAIF